MGATTIRVRRRVLRGILWSSDIRYVSAVSLGRIECRYRVRVGPEIKVVAVHDTDAQ